MREEQIYKRKKKKKNEIRAYKNNEYKTNTRHRMARRQVFAAAVGPESVQVTYTWLISKSIPLPPQNRYSLVILFAK